MAKVFICYHRTERELSVRLRDRLKAYGHSVFLDEDIPPGAMWGEEIERGLTESELVLVLLSGDSITRPYVKAEVQSAYDKQIPLFPIRVRFEGELPYELKGPLNSIQHARWSSPKDDDRLVSQIQGHLVAKLGRVVPRWEGGASVAPVPVGTSLLTDNWLLEDIGACLERGLGYNATEDLVIDSNGEHRWVKIPAAGIQLEGLISLITEIVLRENLIVDQGFIGGWIRMPSLAPLKRGRIIKPVDFPQGYSELPPVRARAVEMLCVSESLRNLQKENEQRWKKLRHAARSRGSQIIWGTAGYLARAHLAKLVYSGHPLRRRFISRTIHHPRGWDAQAHLEEWLRRHRVRLFEALAPNREVRGATFLMPPIAVEVIEACSRLEDVIPTALQVRKHYAELRGWLSAYQKAVEDEEPRALAKHKRDLEAAANEMEREIEGEVSFGATRVNVHVDWRDGTGQRLSARTILSNLLLAKKGESSLRNLLRLFGEERSDIGRQAMNYLREQAGAELRNDAWAAAGLAQ